MNKLKINTILFEKLNELCDRMQVDPIAKSNYKMAEHLRQIHYISNDLTNDLNAMSDNVDDILGALYHKDFVVGIDLLSKAADQAAELQDSINTICDELANALTALRELVEPDTWKPLHTDEEMKKVLNESFDLTNSMSLGYQNGQYALLFEKSDGSEELVIPPVIVAIGGENDINEVRAYIESFMDMEEE